MKNSINVKGLKVVVAEGNLKIYKDDKKVADAYGFEASKEKDNKIAVKLSNRKGILKDFGMIGLEKEQFEELKSIKANIEKAIDNLFENIQTAELQLLSNGIISIVETKEMEELKERAPRYFQDVSENWIIENKQHFTKERNTVQYEDGSMDTQISYKFNRENATEKAETKRVETNNIYTELRELARTMADEDFEDITGRRKEDIGDIGGI